MKVTNVDRLVAGFVLGMLTGGILAGLWPVKVSGVSGVGTAGVSAEPVWPTGQELIIPLTGDPLTDCYTTLAGLEYADSLSGPMCELVREQLG